MSGNSKRVIAFNYFGGKNTWTNHLMSEFPEHYHFIDLFCGSMAVTLNKPPSKIDTANDINSEVVTFFRVLRDNPKELIEQLALTPVSREEYNAAFYDSKKKCTDIEKARRFYVRVRQSFYGLGAQRKNKGWHCVTRNSRASVAETVSKWGNGIDKLWLVVTKLGRIQIENKHFRDLIPAVDFEKAFFYCDPPYPVESRGSQNDYKHEFTNKDHEELANMLHEIKGMAMISSYDCPLMRKIYPDWRLVKFPIKKNNLANKPRQECIWMNYDLDVHYQKKIFDLRHE